MAILDEIQEGIARLAEGAGSSVVGIGQPRDVFLDLVENRHCCALPAFL